MPITIPMTYKQYGQVPFFYANGLGLSNDATTPNSKLDVAIGTIIDSTETYQMELLAPCVISSLSNGLNGLDTGAIAASKVYSVFLISDPVDANPTGAMISLANGVTTFPLMPFGYSAFALIGFVTTDSSKNFLKGYWTNANCSCRLFMYDAPQATAITAGAATSYTAIDLSTLVPAVNNTPVWIYSDLIPNAAGDAVFLQPGGATGDAIKVTGQVTTVHVTSNSLLMARLVTGLPEISYKVSAGTDAVAIDVAGYQFFI